MRRPDTFLIGAPKCGTTALASWLDGHPEVYFSSGKEPMYFNEDLEFRNARTIEEYESFFLGATADHRIVAEGSVFYLFSKVAVDRIEKYTDSPKYVVMLRDPLEMAPSLHWQMAFQGDEHVVNFPQAWALSPERRSGRTISRMCREPRVLDYQHMCRLGEQVERLLGVVDRARVHFVRMDDLKADPRGTYMQVLAFLGIQDDGRSEFSVVNAAKAPRSRVMRQITRKLGTYASTVRKELGIPSAWRTGMLNRLDRANRRAQAYERVPLELQVEMRDFYADDVAKLAAHTGLDLSHWLQTVELTEWSG